MNESLSKNKNSRKMCVYASSNVIDFLSIFSTIERFKINKRVNRNNIKNAMRVISIH